MAQSLAALHYWWLEAPAAIKTAVSIDSRRK
jgi:hypothetical protein